MEPKVFMLKMLIGAAVPLILWVSMRRLGFFQRKPYYLPFVMAIGVTVACSLMALLEG